MRYGCVASLSIFEVDVYEDSITRCIFTPPGPGRTGKLEPRSTF
jgi:hypothetical protein